MSEILHDCHQTRIGVKGNVDDTACYQCGPAIHYCKEDEEYGFLWAGNGEYETMVNFCPFCGYKAKRPAVDQDEWEKIMEAAAKAEGKPCGT